MSLRYISTVHTLPTENLGRAPDPFIQQWERDLARFPDIIQLLKDGKNEEVAAVIGHYDFEDGAEMNAVLAFGKWVHAEKRQALWYIKRDREN